MSVVILHTYFRSSCSARVRIALNWKEVEYQKRFVNLLKNEQNDEGFVKVNVNRRVPVLEMDGQVLTQSLAIVEYLEERFPDKPLLPKDSVARAKVRALVNIINADIQPVQNLSVLQELAEHKRMEWGRKWCHRGFVALEKELEATAGKYCVGDAVTMADVFLAPQIVNAERFSVDMGEFPTIARINQALSALVEFQRAAWNQQEDCPPHLR